MNWRDYAQLARLPAVFTAWADILAAHLLATGGSPEPGALARHLVISTALYWAGMILNDCFDYQVDQRERPGRPLPSGRIPRGRAWKLGFGLIGLGLLIAVFGGLCEFLLVLALAAAILAYDGLLKNHWLGPFAMGACRYLNWLLGLSVVALTNSLLLLGLPIFLYVTSLTFLSRAEVGAESRGPAYLSLAGMLITAGCLTLMILTGVLAEDWAIALVLLGLLAVVREFRHTLTDFRPPRVQANVKFLLLGIIPLDALMLAAGGVWWGAAGVLLLMVPGRILARKTYVT